MNWTKKKLSEICDVKRGKTITLKDAIPGNIPVIGGGLKETYYHNKSNRDSNTITVSGSGANAGYINFYEKPIFASDCTTLEVKDKSTDILYVYFALKNLQNWIYEKLKLGAAQPHVYAKDIAKLEIPCPPLIEQKKIVKILKISNDLISKRNKTIEKLNELSQSIFTNMYEKLDDNQTCLLGDVINIKRGGSPRPITKWLTDDKDGINWIKISDASKSDKYIYSTEQKIKKEGIKMSRYVKNGDFILSNSMSYGRPYILKTDGCIHDGWLLLSDEKKVFEQDFLYSLLCSQSVNYQFKSSATGAVVKNLNINAVKKVKIKLPIKTIQQKFTQEIKKIEDKKALYINQLSKLNDLYLSLNNQIFALN